MIGDRPYIYTSHSNSVRSYVLHILHVYARVGNTLVDRILFSSLIIALYFSTVRGGPSQQNPLCNSNSTVTLHLHFTNDKRQKLKSLQCKVDYMYITQLKL